tara:strand:+ start:94 stop:510 length:417 start_codon:yes stop_codon:yes gene_type:complete
MKKNNIQLIIVITVFLALTASAFFFLKPEVTGNVVLDPENNMEDTETNTDTIEEPVDNTLTTQTNIPNTQPTTTTQTTSTTDLFRSGRRGGGGSSGGSTTPPSDSVVEDKPTDEFVDVLKNSGKTESSVPPPEIPNII